VKGRLSQSRKAGRFELPAIRDPLFELEVAAVEIVKIVADKPGYGRVRLAESKFTEIAAENVTDSE